MAQHEVKSRRQALMEQAIAERRRLSDWLLPHMAIGKPKAFTEDEYRQLATADSLADDTIPLADSQPPAHLEGPTPKRSNPLPCVSVANQK